MTVLMPPVRISSYFVSDMMISAGFPLWFVIVSANLLFEGHVNNIPHLHPLQTHMRPASGRLPLKPLAGGTGFVPSAQRETAADISVFVDKMNVCFCKNVTYHPLNNMTPRYHIYCCCTKSLKHTTTATTATSDQTFWLDKRPWIYADTINADDLLSGIESCCYLTTPEKSPCVSG